MASRCLCLATVVLAVLTGGCSKDDPSPTIIDAGPLVDRCLDPDDMAIVVASWTDAGPDATVPDPGTEAYNCTITPACAELYFNEQYAEAYECVNACLDSKPSGGLSLQCRDCFVLEAVTCAGMYCFTACVGGDGAACSACFAENCTESLDTCIGYSAAP